MKNSLLLLNKFDKIDHEHVFQQITPLGAPPDLITHNIMLQK